MSRIAVFLLCLPITGLYAQEQLGLRIENYAGISAVTFNPAANITNPLRWDFNLAGANFFFDNSFGYVEHASVGKLLRNQNNIEARPSYDNENDIPPNALVFDFRYDNHTKYYSVAAGVMGPSFVYNFPSGHSIGFTTQMRTGSNNHHLPAISGYYEYDQKHYKEVFDVPAFNISAMLWSEIGLSYAYKMSTDYGKLGFGIHLRYLQGYEGVFFENRQDFLAAKLPTDTLQTQSNDYDYGLTTTNTTGNHFSFNSNGKGVGVDLGAIVTFGGEDEDHYKWRLGVSLLDIGKINFNKNAQYHEVFLDDSLIIYSKDYTVNASPDKVMNAVRLFSAQALGGDSTASLKGNRFDIWLPTGFSLQADYNIMPMLYASATLVQRVPIRAGNATLERDNILALTPRFEHRWLSVSVPFVLYEWKKVRVGFAARLGALVIGTDNLGSFMGVSKLSGTDIYVALKINPFDLTWLLGKEYMRKRRMQHQGSKRKVKCYDF